MVKSVEGGGRLFLDLRLLLLVPRKIRIRLIRPRVAFLDRVGLAKAWMQGDGGGREKEQQKGDVA